MNKARNLLTAMLIASVGMGTLASTAEAAAPLKIKIAPYAGTKVKVAKKLKVIVSCSKDCAAKVKVTLLTPAGNTSVKGGRNLKANSGWITGMVLTGYGLSILKNHYPYSRLRISVSARNLSNGTIRNKTKTFRFRR